MIRHTFSILDGTGEKTEKRLWEKGILTWDDFLYADTVPFMNKGKKAFFDQMLEAYKYDLSIRNEQTFARDVKKCEHWRFFNFFSDKAVCLDIETNGRPPDKGGYPTVVGLYNGTNYKCLVRDVDLTWENLYDELASYKFLITFYGSVFDVPFLSQKYPHLKINHLHFDLCVATKRLGMKGGLKQLERILDIRRDDDIQNLTGYDAIRLWENYKRGDKDALDRLVKYNKDDTVNLLTIACELYERLRESTGIDYYISPAPAKLQMDRTNAAV